MAISGCRRLRTRLKTAEVSPGNTPRSAHAGCLVVVAHTPAARPKQDLARGGYSPLGRALSRCNLTATVASGAAGSSFLSRSARGYDWRMAVTAQKLKIGQEVEVDGRLYEVVPDQERGVTLEPAITVSSDELIRRSGGRPATPEEIEAWFGDIPSDGEG